MKTNDTRQNAHAEVDHIFKDLLPAKGMAERPAQAALSHRMLDAMLDGGIALCDAGTGIGKTYAYLVAGTVFHRWRAANGQLGRPLLISTSSIALQTAVVKEYLPFLSCLLMADGMLDRPLRAVIRKGKAHYVCDERLIRRLGHVDLRKKNRQAAEALLSPLGSGPGGASQRLRPGAGMCPPALRLQAGGVPVPALFGGVLLRSLPLPDLQPQSAAGRRDSPSHGQTAPLPGVWRHHHRRGP